MSTPDPTPQTPEAPPVCYRHPDRETYIRCTRCERSICPDCMTSASVGFQCPECIREGARSVRPVRTRLGAKVPTRPYVTIVIIAICVAAFVWQYVAGDQVADRFAMEPVQVAANDQYYRLLTSMFLHANLLHLGLNMVFLWMLGPQLEYLLGHVRFTVLYLVGGLGGGVASFWLSQPYEIIGSTYAPLRALGASGAIFALLGAYVVIGRKLGTDTTQILGLIGINVVLGFVIPNTDWRAHLGGLVTGALVALVLAYAPARSRVLVQVVAVVAILGLLTGAVVVRDQRLTQQMAEDVLELPAP